MSGRITLSPDELRTSAEKYGNGADEIQDILSSLTREQGIIRDNWEGTAFDSFDEQFSELSPQIQKFADLLQDIREQLRSIAGIVEQTDADIASQLRR
jgi:WXG100 family type VII secretion target